MKAAFVTTQLSTLRGGPILLLNFAQAFALNPSVESVLYDVEAAGTSGVKKVLELLANQSVTVYPVYCELQKKPSSILKLVDVAFRDSIAYGYPTPTGVLSAAAPATVDFNTDSSKMASFVRYLSGRYDVVHVGAWDTPYSIAMAAGKSSGKLDKKAKLLCHAFIHPPSSMKSKGQLSGFFGESLAGTVAHRARHLAMVKVLSSFDAVTVSTPNEVSVLRSFGLHNVFLLGEGIDLDQVNRNQKQILSLAKQLRGDLQAEKVIVFVGLRCQKKGYLDLLRAFKVINAQYPKTALLVLGGVPARSENIGIEALEKEFVSKSALHIYSSVSELQKYVLIAASDLLILPSYEEAFPIVFLEAWSMHVPVIGPKISTLASLICTDGDGGLLVTPGDTAAIQEAISKMLHNPELCLAIGNRGYKKVEQQYNLKVISQKLAQLYSFVCNG